MAKSYRGETLLCGVAGATALTAVHQFAQRVTNDAPRMDLVGMRALASGLRGVGMRPPRPDRLYGMTLVGDLVSNSLYYSLVSVGRRPNVWARGAALGFAAGLGALLLPKRMGLGDPPRSASIANQIMTVAWYVVGGLSAAATAACLHEMRPAYEEGGLV